MRKQYLANIRWGTVVLVLIYHVCFLFNTVGIVGGIVNSEGIAAFDVISSLVYVEKMHIPLLILAAVFAEPSY